MTKTSRKDKWRNVSLNESNIDHYLLDLIEDTKGQYITQGVSFNKDDSFQMGLLRQAILNHSSFSGLVKHLLTLYFSGQSVQPNIHHAVPQQQNTIQEFVPPVREEIVVVKHDTPIIRTLPRQEQPKQEPPKETRPTRTRSTSGSGKRTGKGLGGFLSANPNAIPPKE
ncbi:hypothetical protein BSK59_15585 [Paenibacillus odorifer]|uniref:hypothetical protein n=1 Tax=Paenibacillus odorifer TaxID=189426 RepID=UPI00096CBB00|nr:hypothetical protein [Paenibacillus odorifer]OME54001.1 hypothetical protein BSK59_15585 [Paenibacillus odorifer]